jgi:hypothetical protein
MSQLEAFKQIHFCTGVTEKNTQYISHFLLHRKVDLTYKLFYCEVFFCFKFAGYFNMVYLATSHNPLVTGERLKEIALKLGVNYN